MSRHTVDVTDANFASMVLETKGLVLVDFWAPWCGPCKAIAPFLERIGQEFAGEVSVVKLNVDQNPLIAGQFGVRSIPTLVLFRDGEILEEMVGAPDPKRLIDILEEALESRG